MAEYLWLASGHARHPLVLFDTVGYIRGSAAYLALPRYIRSLAWLRDRRSCGKTKLGEEYCSRYIFHATGEGRANLHTCRF